MPTKIIQLTTPVTMHESDPPTTAVELKEPTGGDYLDLGEPRILARNADGTFFWVEDKEAIKSYLNKCLVHKDGPHVLRLMSMKDVRAIREELFGFFADSAQTTSAES